MYLERIVGEVMRCHARLVEHGVISVSFSLYIHACIHEEGSSIYVNQASESRSRVHFLWSVEYGVSENDYLRKCMHSTWHSHHIHKFQGEVNRETQHISQQPIIQHRFIAASRP